MRDQDIEDTLRRHEAHPSPEVKRAVMERFAASRRSGPWRKGIPLYLVAASLVLAVGLGVLIGRVSVGSGMPGAQTPDGVVPAGASPETVWSVAEPDVL